MELGGATMNGLGLAFAFASVLQLATPKSVEDLSFTIVPRQSHADSCGYAVLAGLLRIAESRGQFSGESWYYPGMATETSLMERYRQAEPDEEKQSGNDRLTILGMIKILDDFRISSIPVKLDPQKISGTLERISPIILHYDKPRPHFTLGLGRDADSGLVVVADPESGLAALPESELAARASGYALLPLLKTYGQAASGGSEEAAAGKALVRRLFLERAASRASARPPGDEQGDSDFQAAFGVFASTLKRENGASSFFPGVFFAGDWAVSKELRFMMEASAGFTAASVVSAASTMLTASASQTAPLKAKASPAPVQLRASAGLEWHRENEAKDTSIGFAFIAAAMSKAIAPAQAASASASASAPAPAPAPAAASASAEVAAETSALATADQADEDKSSAIWLLGPQFRFRYSTIVDPFLLSGTLGFSPLLRFEEGERTEIGFDKGSVLVRKLLLLPSCAAFCALTPTLAGKIALGQSFIFDVNGSAEVVWEGRLELGMQIASNAMSFYVGTRFRLDERGGPSGEVLFSCSL